MPVTIIDKDMGFERVKLDFKQLRDRQVRVGIWGDEVVDYAIYNEFGTSRMPARPFMQTTYNTHMPKVLKFVEYLTGQIIDGKTTPDHVLRTVGEKYQAAIQMTIRDAKTWAVPNDPYTVQRKGSSSPLIDTGRMLASVRYEVS